MYVYNLITYLKLDTNTIQYNTMIMKIHYKILKNSIYWSKVNVSKKKNLNTLVKKNAIKFLGFDIKNNSF